MYPVFPVHVRALMPLYPYGSLIWLSGVLCLWATRYTHQLGKRWGRRYYVASVVVRPLGMALITLGWLALYASREYDGYESMGLLPHRNAVDLLCWVAVAAFSALGGWSVLTLGLRCSFLFRSYGDPLVTHGPYAVVRHPQFLSVIGMTFFGIRIFDPTVFWGDAAYSALLNANWALFTLALWVLAILEDQELAAHFGRRWDEYGRRVPRLLPNQ